MAPQNKSLKRFLWLESVIVSEMQMKSGHLLFVVKFTGSQVVLCNMEKTHITVSYTETGTGTIGKLGECVSAVLQLQKGYSLYH